MSDSILHEAREIVRTQPMNLYVGHLKTCADNLHEAYDAIRASCTREAATTFVAALNRTLIAIDRVHAFTPPTSSGGRMTVPQTSEEKAVTGQA